MPSHIFTRLWRESIPNLASADVAARRREAAPGRDVVRRPALDY
jgi:hypothetical protein